MRVLLDGHADARAAVNEPLADSFDALPVHLAKKNLPLLDALLAHRADLNAKTRWWAGGFGVLEYDITPDEARPLIDRGAVVDVFAAAHLGMLDRLRELVDRDPSLVHARGGDGRTPLHCASGVEIAAYLLDRGAAIDARDVDHESTAAQHLVGDHPGVARLLVDRGAWCDIFLAVGLRDAALVARCLADDPGALSHRTWQGKYRTTHEGRSDKRAATPAEIGDGRGDIYRWVFGHNVSPLDAAFARGYDDIATLLLTHASPVERLLAACGRGNRAAAEAVVAEHPSVVNTLSPTQQRLIADRAHANDTAAVSLMLDLGFDPATPGPEDVPALNWAAFQGNAELVARLLAFSPPLEVEDPRYRSTPLGWCLHGSVHGWRRETGDFAHAARLLLDAGAKLNPAAVPTGREDVDAVLREHLARRGSPG